MKTSEHVNSPAPYAPGGVRISRRAVAGSALAFLAVLLGAGDARAQKSFAMEVRLALEQSPKGARTLSRADEHRMRDVLLRRVEAIAGKGGSVEVASADEIRVLIPSERVTPAELKTLCRVGRLEVRLLQNVRSSTNLKARYFIDTLSVQSGHTQSSSLRIRDQETGRVVPLLDFLPKCPLLLNSADLEKDGARVVGSPPLIAVRVTFNAAANEQLDFFAKPGTMLAVTLDGELISINAMESSTAKRPKRKRDELPELDVLAGFNTPEEAAALAASLNAGVLPAPLAVSGYKLIAQ